MVSPLDGEPSTSNGDWEPVGWIHIRMNEMGTSSASTDTNPEWLLRLLPRHLSQLKALAEGAWPFECCGMLVGRRTDPPVSRVIDVWAARNVATEGRRRFELAPEELIAGQRRARARDLEILGYFHSHPDAQARPSRLDLAAAWRGLSYLILELRDGRWRRARSWRIDSEGVAREERTLIQPEESA